MFKKLAHNAFIKMQMKEGNAFLEMLKVADSNELGFVVALAADVRNDLFEQGFDLQNPIVAHELNPRLVINLLAEVKQMQKNNMQHLVPGHVIWICSLRAANDLKLRAIARKIWGELERGFPHAESGAEEATFMFGVSLDTTNFNKFPTSLTPKPL